LDLRAKASRVNLLEEQFEYGKALALLKEVIDGKAATEAETKHYEELSAAWQEKGEKHAQARQFIYETWATLDPLKVKDNLAAAQSAFEECKRVGDKLAPKRLRFIAVAHVGQLKAKVKSLDADSGKEEDRETAKLILDISDGLLKLVQDINAFVDK
jgi:hypothetical protein